jgi:hypothetical protein
MLAVQMFTFFLCERPLDENGRTPEKTFQRQLYTVPIEEDDRIYKIILIPLVHNDMFNKQSTPTPISFRICMRPQSFSTPRAGIIMPVW